MGLIAKSNTQVALGAASRGHASLESFNHDGVEVARRRTRRRVLPVRQIAYFLIAVLSFKVFLYFDMGGSAYGGKIQELSQGAAWERVAARAMVLDPVSKWFVDGLRFGRW